MGFWALLIVNFFYGTVAFNYWSKEEYALAWVFLCYAGANIGFMIHLKGLS